LYSKLTCLTTLITTYDAGVEDELKDESFHGGSANTNPNTPGHCLLLPGKRLDLKALLKKKKFRDPHGYKKGALAAFSELEQAGLGVGETVNTKYGSVSKDVHVYGCRYNSVTDVWVYT